MIAACESFKVWVTLGTPDNRLEPGRVERGRGPLLVRSDSNPAGTLVATDALQYFAQQPGKAGSFGMFMGWYVQLRTYASGRYTITGPASWGGAEYDKKGSLSVTLTIAEDPSAGHSPSRAR